MQQKIHLTDAVELFYLDIKARQFTKNTQRFYKERLSLLLAWCKANGVEYLQDLTHIHIRKYIVSYQDRRLSSSYVNGHARAIRAFLNYAVRDELIDKSPFAKVEMPKLSKKILPALTGDQVRKILDHCKSERDEAIIMFLIDSGCRASEAIALNVADVDLSTGSVTVTQGKGQKDRVTLLESAPASS
jgi:integrase/recombinase XerD